MFLRVPISNEDYWVIVEDNAAEKITDRFDKLWKSGKTVENGAQALLASPLNN
jgi:hypothetical protein